MGVAPAFNCSEYCNHFMRGEDVKKLQRALGFTEEKIDGIFGKKTDRAVRDFQKIHGVEG